MSTSQIIDATQFATWAKAFGHPIRVQIVEILLAQEGCMCGSLAELIGCPQSTLSQHLKSLKNAGVIQGTIDGPRICYCVKPDVLEGMMSFISGLHTIKEHCCEGDC